MGLVGGDGLNVYWVNQATGTPDQPGGTRHFDMAAALVRRGSKVTLVASDLSLLRRTYSRRHTHWDLRPRREQVCGVDAVWLSAGRYERNDWRRLASMVLFGAGAFVYLGWQRRRAGSVVIGSSPHLFGALGAWGAARVRRIPFILEVRDLWPESYTALTGRTSGGLLWLMRWIADLLYARACAIVVLAEGSIDAIASKGVPRERIHFVPNGVDMARFEKQQARGTHGSCLTFAYTGAHGPANGLEVLVRACALLQSSGHDHIKVLLVGDGPAKDALIDQARRLKLRNLEFRDPVPSEQMPMLLSSVDAGLMLLARAELFSYGVSPNKVFEYLAAGLPIVNNVPGAVADLIDRAGAGESCAAGDAEALANTIVAVGSEIVAGTARYRSGRSFVERHYDRRVLAVRLEGILREVVSGTVSRAAGDR